MIFEENNKAIYLQIADRICDDIMQGKYDSDNRIPSVREYAASVEVNANTVMRSYERLTSRNLIFNKRGIGFFVSPDAKEKIRCEKSEELMQKQLPPLFRLMCSLGISPDTLKKAYVDFLSANGQPV
ncbi:MAG: GntR family transcriptional regulator [Muribaculaceae bacterium]|nr:GntR family transcriptional regulator [Muribaculaceae bacterium]